VPGQSREGAIRERAKTLGFDAVGFADAREASDQGESLHAFTAAGYHGEMAWLPETAERRRHPQALWPAVRGIVALAMSYGPDEPALTNLTRPALANVSVYARGRDYHDVVKGKLKQLAQWIAATWSAEVKVFVDTAPVMEKPLAAQAGLGWQGKHTNLLSRELGNWFFLGFVFTDMALTADPAEPERCGSCRACLDSCPTDAFPAPFRLDARRCISYLTIEHKGPIPRALRPAIGNRVYGCDDCLAVCPWNKFAAQAKEQRLSARDDLKAPALSALLAQDEAAFRAFFSGSPVKRTGYVRFQRNLLIALGNSGLTAHADMAVEKLDHPDPLIRGAAVWALGRLAPAHVSNEAAKRLANEKDPTVRAEWQAEMTASHV